MLLDLTALSLWTVSAILAGAELVICLAGTRLAHLADTLADRTGMGEIIAGALFVGAAPRCPASSPRSPRRRRDTRVWRSATQSAG